MIRRKLTLLSFFANVQPFGLACSWACSWTYSYSDASTHVSTSSNERAEVLILQPFPKMVPSSPELALMRYFTACARWPRTRPSCATIMSLVLVNTAAAEMKTREVGQVDVTRGRGMGWARSKTRSVESACQ